MNLLATDTPPTALQEKTLTDANTRAAKVTARWKAAQGELALLNSKLKAAGQSPLS